MHGGEQCTAPAWGDAPPHFDVLDRSLSWQMVSLNGIKKTLKLR